MKKIKQLKYSKMQVLCCIAVLTYSLLGCQKKKPEEARVTFQDPVFQEMFDEYGFRETSEDILPILPTQEQLDRITALNLHFPNGKECDLIDLKAFPNLRGILINNATENEIQQISSQDQIKALWVGCMDASVDMSALGKMDNVEALVISGPRNGVADWSFVAEMEQLESLCILWINLDDLNFLRSLKKLERLEIDDVNIKDISALETMTGLKYLIINSDDKNDYSPALEKMKNMEQLSISNTPMVTNLDFLKEMTQLDRLLIENIGTKISPEWLTTENYLKLGVIRFDEEMAEINKTKLEKMKPILEKRYEQNQLEIRFQDPRINFPVLLEHMEPVETYDE